MPRPVRPRGGKKGPAGLLASGYTMSPRYPADRSGPASAPGPASGEPTGDPWAAFGYLVSGVLFYGAVGYGLSVWFHAPYWIPIGIVVGAGFGMYLVFHRYRYRGDDTPSISATSIENGRRHTPASDRDDRGDNT